jgi:murein DD-endopeptidase MepM/ murein hydrolase activator NlpD
VFKVGKEEETGSYGGFVVLKHTVNNTPFYSIYGHLKTPHQVTVGQSLRAGEIFAEIGVESDSGGWFSHTHLQIITQKSVDEGLIEQKGYASAADLPQIEEYFPSPYFLFRY